MLSSTSVKSHARALGFDLCGIAPAERFPELDLLAAWIARRYYGTMSWIPRTARVRRDVRAVLPGARSVVVTGTVYNTAHPYVGTDPAPDRAVLSRYAWGEDYHAVVGRRLDALLAWMRAESPEGFEGRAYVDTGPVQERVFAHYAGIGWIGKNTCLINPQLGSWIFLGVAITTAALDADAPAVDHCGSCQRCLQACPTGAIVEPRVLDATRCLSYLTIEKRKAIPEALRAPLGAHVYGCDICQEVCPFNARPAVSADPAWQPRPALRDPSLLDLWRASDRELEALIEGTAMTRAGVLNVRRNLATAIGNDATADPAWLEPMADDEARRPSLGDPYVAEHVAWARGRLAAAAAPASAAPRGVAAAGESMIEP